MVFLAWWFKTTGEPGRCWFFTLQNLMFSLPQETNFSESTGLNLMVRMLKSLICLAINLGSLLV